MMEKRLFLAIILSLLVLLIYPLFMPRHHQTPRNNQQLIENKEDTIIKEPDSPLPLPTSSPEPSPPPPPSSPKPLGKIASLLLAILKSLHSVLKNWGWAIIGLSLLIWLFFLPLTHKMQVSMKRMQQLGPEMEELRKRFKDQPQKLNKEIMGLYKKHRVNPLGGCLPLLFQMPIFFGLYQMLRNCEAIKGANFLWIKDLSKPDALFPLSPTLAFNLLPILMILVMFLQQKLTASNPASAEQKKMTMLFPVFFGIIFYNFPAGLVLYWLTNSTLTFFYQWKVSK